MSKEIIRVFIVDDHPIVRQGLEVVINAQTDMRLVGQATDGKNALMLIEEAKPDVVLMDLKMPTMNGLTAIEELQKKGLDTRILVLTSFPEDEMVISAIQLGADGVMLKDSPPEQLMKAVRDLMQGINPLHPMVTQKLMANVQQPSRTKSLEQLLTSREIIVLQYLGQGLTNKEIAKELSISTRTVTTHVQNILNKLGLDNRTQAALYASRHGLL